MFLLDLPASAKEGELHAMMNREMGKLDIPPIPEFYDLPQGANPRETNLQKTLNDVLGDCFFM